MAVTRGNVSGPVFAGLGAVVGTPVASVSLVLGVPMSGQVLVWIVAFRLLAGDPTVTDTQGNLYTNIPIVIAPGQGTGWSVRLFAADLTRGIPLTGGDTITATFPGGGNTFVASVQAADYFGVDITNHTAGYNSSVEIGAPFGTGFVTQGAAGPGLGLVLHLRAGNANSDDPTATFTPTGAATMSFVASGDTGVLAHAGTAGAYRYYSYDVTNGPGTEPGNWLPITAAAQYVQVFASFGPLAIGGVSLARSSAGFMFAGWNDRESVWVARSTDQCDTWPLQKRVAGDAANDASPWLTVDAWDELTLWYHSAAGFMSVWRLPGLLDADPVQIVSAHPYTFPVAVIVRPELQIIAAFNGANLQVFQSADYGVTTVLVKDYGAQKQERPALIMDRWGGLHLIYRTLADQLYQDYCRGPGADAWDGAVLFTASGAYPSLAAGPLDAFVTWFGPPDLAVLNVAALQPDYHLVSNLVGGPDTTILPGSPGTWIDEHDEWWFLGRLNTNYFGPPPPGSPPGDPGLGGAIIGGGPGGGGGIGGGGSGFQGGAIGDIE